MHLWTEGRFVRQGRAVQWGPPHRIIPISHLRFATENPLVEKLGVQCDEEPLLHCPTKWPSLNDGQLKISMKWIEADCV
ncbi:hypothetical protein COLO4_19255 [Corchorus olitorius]|uniref:Uncharacterized protein n=1 Tax=Corchorus olitorius TaxID=93759 RepID=A0A1R3J651_9ROSI|nr:hypothetical protein COLO4_19255 [Corchorus olitorius]